MHSSLTSCGARQGQSVPDSILHRMHIQHRTLLVGVQVDEIEPYCSGTVFLAALGCQNSNGELSGFYRRQDPENYALLSKYLPSSLIPISPSISQTRPACRCPSIPAKVGPATGEGDMFICGEMFAHSGRGPKVQEQSGAASGRGPDNGRRTSLWIRNGLNPPSTLSHK